LTGEDEPQNRLIWILLLTMNHLSGMRTLLARLRQSQPFFGVH
jgi:hypothetical protein